MSNVDFEENFKSSNNSQQGFSEPKGLSGLLIKTGIVSNAKSAEIVLLVIAIASFAASIYIAISFLFPSSPTASNENPQSFEDFQRIIEQAEQGQNN